MPESFDRGIEAATQSIGPEEIGFDPDQVSKWAAGDKVEYQVHGNAALGRRKHSQWVIGDVLGTHPMKPYLWIWTGKRKAKVHPGLVRKRSAANLGTTLPPYLTPYQKAKLKKPSSRYC